MLGTTARLAPLLWRFQARTHGPPPIAEARTRRAASVYHQLLFSCGSLSPCDTMPF